MAFTIADNNVPAVEQVQNNTGIYYLGKDSAPKRLLIVGNSITWHSPKAEIGWFDDWGMAASSADKDYVHLLSSRLLEQEDLLVMVRQYVTWEQGYKTGDFSCEDARNFMADEIIFRLGENVPALQNDAEEEEFYQAILAFLQQINPKGGKVYFTTCFWRHERTDNAICRAAETLNMPVIDLNPLGKADENMAVGLFEHEGVAHHPGDLGMQRIADMIYSVMRG